MNADLYLIGFLIVVCILLTIIFPDNRTLIKRDVSQTEVM